MGRVFSMINPEQVSSTIERMVSNRSISYMDAVLELCEEHSIDTTMIAKYLSKPIIENIEKEAMDVNLLPKKKSLPFS
jgi:hypothetical protein